MGLVTGLSYVGVSGADLTAWRGFAGLLGLAEAPGTVGSADRADFRVDERAVRLSVRRGAPGLDHVGWDVPGPAALAEVAARLQSLGHAVKTGDDALAAERQVRGIVTTAGPDGVTTEFCWGARESAGGFTSPAGARFVTGDGGLGHVVVLTPDPAAWTAFYEDGLGFGLSDVETEFGIDMRFLHCNPRHHSLAFGATPPGVPAGLQHIMVEVDDIDQVGRVHDACVGGAAPLLLDLGRHSNDLMISFYAISPSGFSVEYGTGGLRLDPASWVATSLDGASRWGHRLMVSMDEALAGTAGQGS